MSEKKEVQDAVVHQTSPAEGGDDLDFSKLVEESLQIPKEGEIVKGRIAKITGNEVFIDIGGKSEGVAQLHEFRNAEIHEGDEVYVYVETLEGRNGRTIVSKQKADFLRAWDQIKAVYDDNKTVEAKVLRQVKGGLIVEIFGVDAFLPGSHIDVRKVKSISSFVGRTIPVKVIKLNKARKNIVVSRREVLEEQMERAREWLHQLKPGDVLEGVVKNITDFGVFVRVGDKNQPGVEIDGLVHISDLAWHKVRDPREIVQIGEKVRVQVLDVDPQNLKLSLSMKHLTPHPWEQVKERYPVGAKIKGRVTRIMDYGVFVEVEPGVEGLVHISEMTWGKPPNHPSDLVKVGDEVEVVVLNVDVEKQRLSLGMKQAKPDPWSMIEEKYPKGSVVKGTVVDFGNFGAYIEIEDGIEGFLHVADISWTKKFTRPQEALRKGQKVRLKVMGFDKRNRILELSLKDLQPNPWDEIVRRLPPGSEIKTRILSLNEHGAVVEVTEGLEGFVPRSHLARKGNPMENYEVGEEINVKVLRIEPQRKRVLLSEREYVQAKEKADMARYRPEPARISLGELLKPELERLKALMEQEAAAAEAAAEEETPEASSDASESPEA